MSPNTGFERWSPLPLAFPAEGLVGQVEDGPKRGGAALAMGIWAPTLLLAGGAIATGYTIAGLAMGALAMVVHSLIDPRVAVIAMILVIPCDWMVTAIPQVSTVSKLLGVWALFVSLPKLLPSVAPNAWDPCVKWIGGLIVWAAIGLFWARYPQAVIGGWQSLVLTWGIPVLVCIQFKDMASVRALLILYVIGCTLSAAAYILVGDVHAAAEGSKRLESQSLIGGGQEEGINPNSIARNFGLAFFAAIYLIIVFKGVVRRLLLVGGLMVIILAIMILKARAVYLALPGALVASVVMLKGGGLARRMSLVLVMSVIGGAAGLVAMKTGFLGEGVEQRFASIFEEGVHSGNRLDLWTAHVKVFLASGMMGVGLNQMAYRSESLAHVAHNDWFSLLGTLGLVGVACFAAFHFNLARRMWRLEDVWAKMLCLGLWTFLLACGLTQDDYVHKHYTIAVGIILALMRIEEERNSLSGLQAAPAAMDSWSG